MLASYLSELGFSALQIGAIVTATLLGSAVVTLAAGLLSNRLDPYRVLSWATVLMLATGLGFAAVTDFWPLMLVAFAGTMNPSAGDVSVFLPTEQSLLTGVVSPRERTALFARYNLGGAFAGALGALASGIPVYVAHNSSLDLDAVQRLGFLGYAAVAVVIAWLYRGLAMRAPVSRVALRGSPLRESRRVVLKLSALFSLDSFGGGLVVQSLLVLWLFERFDLSVAVTGTVFFATGILSAFSQLASSWLASRIGLIRTMVFTHLPANGFLILAALMPTAPLAVLFLLLRMALSQMDVPARQSYVMAVVPPEERPAAASITNVPRSLASALTPFLAGAMLHATTFGWPLIAAGLLKIVYDLLLLWQFQHVRPPEEGATQRSVLD
jgi:MFS family permease